MVLIHHGKHGDGFPPVAFHLLQGLHHQHIGLHRDRIGSHQILRRQMGPCLSTVILQGTAQISIREDPEKASRAVWVFNPTTADSVARQPADHLGQGGVGLQGVQLAGGNHQVGGREGELFAKGSGGVIQGEIRRRDAPSFHPDRSQGIADRHGHRCAGGGSQVQRTHLTVNAGL